MITRLLIVLLLLLVPAVAAVPTPASHFGHKIGVDNEAALVKGMEAKAVEFVKKGAEIYTKA